MDGFDSYSTGSDLFFQYGGNGGYIGTTSGRFGQGAYEVTNFAYYLSKTLPNPVSEIWTGWAMKMAPNTSLAPLFLIISSSGIEAELFYNASTNAWYATKGQAGSQIGGSGIRNIADNNWHYIEFHYKCDTSVGIVEVWIDNTQVFSNIGYNTTYYGSLSFTGVRFAGDGSTAIAALYDDWYMLDAESGAHNTTRLGDSRIQTLRPSSDVGPNNGTPSVAGPHYEMVNAPQNNGGATTITLTGTSGQEELFGMTSLASTPTTIFAARVLNYAEKTDAGTLNANAVISSNSIVGNGNTQALLTNFTGNFGIFETDPSTSNAWSPSAINSVACGFKIA